MTMTTTTTPTPEQQAAALLRRWVTYHDTQTRSEPMHCIARDSRDWLQDHAPAGTATEPAAAAGGAA